MDISFYNLLICLYINSQYYIKAMNYLHYTIKRHKHCILLNKSNFPNKNFYDYQQNI